MTTLAVIKQIYLYPIKSMRGVSVQEAQLTVNGFAGDRRFAFVQQGLAGTDGFPWMTGREKPRMILDAPRFARPPTAEDWDVPIHVATPDGAHYAVTDPRLCEHIAQLLGQPVFLLKTKRGNFDSQHVSLFSLQTLAQLETESGVKIDPRQFRANLYIEPVEPTPFIEDAWVGQVLRLGEHATIGVTKKDSRCMMINLNPDTAVQQPAVLRTVARAHDECAGIYANVVRPGVVRVGDKIDLILK